MRTVTKHHDKMAVVNFVILLVILVAYLLSNTGFAQAINRNSTAPVFSSNTATGVAVEVTLCGKADVQSLCELAQETPLAVFLCADTMRLMPGAKYDLTSAGATVGVYECGVHALPQIQDEYVLISSDSTYTGRNKLRYSLDATAMSEDDLESALFEGSIVHVSYTDVQMLKKVLNIIAQSGYTIVDIQSMI